MGIEPMQLINDVLSQKFSKCPSGRKCVGPKEDAYGQCDLCVGFQPTCLIMHLMGNT